MAAKRPHHASASVLAIAHVLVTIVQCTPSPTDVASFLQALPPALVTQPLAALRQILGSVQPSKESYIWPRPNLCDVNDTLLVAAMRIFNAVCIGGYSWREDPLPHVNFGAPFCRFIANWTTKVTHVELLESPIADHREACYNLLRQCTSLRHAQLPCETPLLEAITTPAHRVSDLELNLPPNGLTASVFTADAVSVIERWLASGFARRLTLTSFRTPDARLARALASSTLSGLALDSSRGVLHSLVENGIALTHLKELDLNDSFTPANGFRQLTPLLDLPKIEKLTLTKKRDSANCILMLPCMAALTHLSLDGVKFAKGEMLPDIGPPALRCARFDGAAFSTPSFRALLSWALSSPQLESITWTRCNYIKSHIDEAARAMRQCLAAGVRRMSFTRCNLAHSSAKALANYLVGTHARKPFELDLSFNKFTTPGQRYLTAALATCTNITIYLRGEISPYFSDEDRVHAKTIGVTIRSDGLDIFVCSPTQPPSSTSASMVDST